MTFEEMERTMEFIVNQQAKFSVDIDLLKEAQAILTANMAEMKVQAEQDRELMKAMFRHLSDNAEADRRMVREMVQDLKGLFYQVDAKADKALRLAQKNDTKE
ncbi:MAG TPA: hypothetical protein PKZ53_22915 [Acidobacteriota bacterium]|nr:hypothetical protein [Acidobacteriota bacterium]HNJ43356.1 hypothetical protein [Acidobacteriota bacterium]